MNTFALVIGYVVVVTGSILLTALLIGLTGWAVLEWWWRRHRDVKLLREFTQWKRSRYPG
jgi:hypothetical protein